MTDQETFYAPLSLNGAIRAYGDTNQNSSRAATARRTPAVGFTAHCSRTFGRSEQACDDAGRRVGTDSECE